MLNPILIQKGYVFESNIPTLETHIRDEYKDLLKARICDIFFTPGSIVYNWSRKNCTIN